MGTQRRCVSKAEMHGGRGGQEDRWSDGEESAARELGRADRKRDPGLPQQHGGLAGTGSSH